MDHAKLQECVRHLANIIVFWGQSQFHSVWSAVPQWSIHLRLVWSDGRSDGLIINRQNQTGVISNICCMVCWTYCSVIHNSDMGGKAYSHRYILAILHLCRWTFSQPWMVRDIGFPVLPLRYCCHACQTMKCFQCVEIQSFNFCAGITWLFLYLTFSLQIRSSIWIVTCCWNCPHSKQSFRGGRTVPDMSDALGQFSHRVWTPWVWKLTQREGPPTIMSLLSNSRPRVLFSNKVHCGKKY